MKKLLLSFIPLSMVVVLNGCAKRPSSIATSYIPYQKYDNKTCTKLATLMSDARAEIS